jgi:hypothetical protein
VKIPEREAREYVGLTGREQSPLGMHSSLLS